MADNIQIQKKNGKSLDVPDVKREKSKFFSLTYLFLDLSTCVVFVWMVCYALYSLMRALLASDVGMLDKNIWTLYATAFGSIFGVPIAFFSYGLPWKDNIVYHIVFDILTVLMCYLSFLYLGAIKTF